MAGLRQIAAEHGLPGTSRMRTKSGGMVLVEADRDEILGQLTPSLLQRQARQRTAHAAP